MNNISGSAKSWIAEEKIGKVKVENNGSPIKKDAPVLNVEIDDLLCLLEKIQDKYEISPNKNLFDAMVSLESAIMSIKMVN